MVADVPGCVALGGTVDEAVAEMREAIKLHLELLGERGAPTGPRSRRGRSPRDVILRVAV
nr:hypothetical protein GCM10020063_090040 [Dactylosporangium thailandense]